MRFFLMARHRPTGEVRLVSDTTYDTREEALDVLAGETASDIVSEDDLFVVDLDTVTPVVLYRAPAAAVPETVTTHAEPEALEEPMADAWETPAEEAEAEAEEIASIEAPSVEEAAAVEEPLADEAAAVEEAAEEEEVPSEEHLYSAAEVAWEAAIVEELLSPGTAGDEAVEVEAAASEVASDEGVTEEAVPVEAGAEEPVVDEAVAGIEEALAAEEPPETFRVGGAEEVPLEEAPVAEAAAEEVAAGGEASVEEDLASALRKAASSMEDSGIVAPPSVEEFAAAGAPADEAAGEGAAAEGPVAVEQHADVWPWEAESATAAPGAEDAGGADQSTDELIAALEAVAPSGSAEPAPEVPHETGEAVPSVEEVAEHGFGPIGEDAVKDFLASDEAAVPKGGVGVPASEPAGEGGEEAAAPYVPVGIEEAGMEEISLLTPAEPASLTIPEGDPEYPGLIDPEPVEDKTYEAGEGGIESYTCDDCVYVATCPKNHQDSPATCGAFQWKPV